MAGFKWANPGCCCGSSGHTIGTCGCTGIPDTLYLRATRYDSANDLNLFQNCSLVWGSPPVTPTAPTTGFGWFSTTTFTTNVSVQPMFYAFGCASGGGNYVLGLFYRSPSTGVYGMISGYSRVWPLPGSGVASCSNVCSPFAARTANNPGNQGDWKTVAWVSTDSAATPSPNTFCVRVGDLSAGDAAISGASASVTLTGAAFLASPTISGTTDANGKLCTTPQGVGGQYSSGTATKAGYKAIAGTTNGPASPLVTCSAGVATAVGRVRLVPTSTAAFSFAVYDRSTELPMSGVSVSVNDNAGHTSAGTTDANGLFATSGLTTGTWTVTVTAPTGYTSLSPFNVTVSAANNIQLVYLIPT